MRKGQNRLFIFNVFVILMVLLVASCSKKKGAGSMYDIIPGKWHLTQYGSDDNLNGRIDYFEKHAVAAGSLYEMVYDANGTGVHTNTNNGVTSMALNYRWELINGDSLRISYDANDTITYYIATSTAGSLGMTRTSKIENSNKVGIEWLFFSKQ